MKMLVYKVKQIWWFIINKCEFDGGEIEIYSWKKAFCIKCGKKN